MRAALFAVLLLVGCGPSMLDDSQQVSTSSQELEALVISHTEGTTAADCAAQMATYQAEANTMLGRFESRCPGLDGCMSRMGHPDQSDMMRGATDLRAELDAHVAAGCSAASLADELARHRTVMVGHCQHLRTRTGSMLGSMRGSMMGCR